MNQVIEKPSYRPTQISTEESFMVSEQAGKLCTLPYTRLCEAGIVLCNIVRTRIIEPGARKLELRFLVRSDTFLFFVLRPWLRRLVLAVFSLPYPREGISDTLAGGSIIPLRYSSRRQAQHNARTLRPSPVSQ